MKHMNCSPHARRRSHYKCRSRKDVLLCKRHLRSVFAPRCKTVSRAYERCMTALLPALRALLNVHEHVIANYTSFLSEETMVIETHLTMSYRAKATSRAACAAFERLWEHVKQLKAQALLPCAGLLDRIVKARFDVCIRHWLWFLHWQCT